MNLSKIFKQLKMQTHRHSPELLLGIGIGGMISSTVMAVKSTPKALAIIENEKKRQTKAINESIGAEGEHISVNNLKKKEIVKLVWKEYVPSAVIGGLSIACILSANSINSKRKATLATMCSLSESAFRDYKNEVINVLGEEKEKEVREKIAEKHVKEHPLKKSSNVMVMGADNVLCFESTSGRYFNSNKNEIEKAVNYINRTIINENYASLNDFFDVIGLDYLPLGEELGWNLDDEMIEIEYDAVLVDGKPCLHVGYNKRPHTNYSMIN